MGSAAFLNEAVNQLAETYLELKQAELNRRIPHDAYPRELQKVRMYLADRNVFGVDLNPVAVELAEVSLWLNAIYGEDEAEDGTAASGARALVRLSVVCRQQPDRRASRGVSAPRNWSGMRNQPGTTRRRAGWTRKTRCASPTRSITSCCPTRAWPTTPTRSPASSMRRIVSA